MNLRGSRRGCPENFFRARPPPRPENAPFYTPQARPRGRNTRAYPSNKHCQRKKIFYAAQTPNHQVNASVSC